MDFYKSLVTEKNRLLAEREKLSELVDAIDLLLNRYQADSNPEHKSEDADTLEVPDEYDPEVAAKEWHENRKKVKEQYQAVKNYVLSLEHNKQYSAQDDIRLKLNLDSYYFSYFYQKLKTERIITATARGLFELNSEYEKSFSPETEEKNLPETIIQNEDEKMIHEQIREYILSLDRNFHYQKRAVLEKFKCSYTTLCIAVNQLKIDGIIVDNLKSRWIIFKNNTTENRPSLPLEKKDKPSKSTKAHKTHLSNNLPEPKINEDESIQSNVYRYITSLSESFEYNKNDILAKFPACSQTNFNAVVLRLIKENLILDDADKIKFVPEDSEHYYTIDEKAEKEYKIKVKDYISQPVIMD